jgi:hypothetical protein
VNGADRQAGDLFTYYWTSRQGEACLTLAIDGIPSFGPPVRVVTGEPARLRLLKVQQPYEVALARVRPGRVVGALDMALPFRLRRTVIGGELVGWDVVFTPRDTGHLYLILAGWWVDEEGCHISQDAFWAFHAVVEAPPDRSRPLA